MLVASIAIGLSRKIGNGFTFPARNILPSSNVISCARPTANVGTSIFPPRLTASITIRSNSNDCVCERAMIAATVSGLQKNKIGLLEWFELAQYRRAARPEIAGKNDALGFAVFL